MAADAILKLRPGDVHAVNGPARRQVFQVFPIADADFKCQCPRFGHTFEDMAENLHPGPANPAQHDQEGLLPRSESDPARAIVERRCNPVSSVEGPDRLQDAVTERISTPAIGTVLRAWRGV